MSSTTKSSNAKVERAREKKEQMWEEQEVHEKSAASATIVYKAILKEAEEELVRPSLALAAVHGEHAHAGFVAAEEKRFADVKERRTPVGNSADNQFNRRDANCV